MPASQTVIVVGLGAMGSAAALHLARRGCRVLGFDRFTPPHSLGSSHGRTRIIREAYFEHPSYVPLLQRAYQLWRELEAQAGETLLLQTGGIMIGAPESEIVSGALASAREHGLPHESLDAREIHRRFPALSPEPDMIGVFEPRAGVLFPERCIARHLEAARTHGADLHPDEPVLGWEPSPDGGVTVTTTRAVHHAQQIVVTAGAWAASLCPGLALPFRIERQVLHWFEPVPRSTHSNATAESRPDWSPARCPVHLWQCDGNEFFYGFPDTGEGVKVARHHGGAETTADTVDRTVSSAEVEGMRSLLRRFLPGANGPLRESAVCVYTNTPDGHFWIDRHPQHPQVLVASPCSGHGFKFASVMGEVLADLVTTGNSRFDLRLFRSR